MKWLALLMTTVDVLLPICPVNPWQMDKKTHVSAISPRGNYHEETEQHPVRATSTVDHDNQALVKERCVAEQTSKLSIQLVFLLTTAKVPVLFATIVQLLVILEIWSILKEAEAAMKWSSGDEEGQDEQQGRARSATAHIEARG